MRTRIAPFALLSLLACVAPGCLDGEPEVETDEADIIGGVDAKSASLDAVGTVGTMGYDGKYGYFCTAALIAPKVVLTAKHCAAYGPDEEPRLRSEKIYFATGWDSKNPKQVIEAVDVLVSPVAEGGMVEYGSDVAVYILAEPVKDIAPLPYLPGHLGEDTLGQKFTAVGYGVHDRDRNSGVRKAGQLTMQGVKGQPMHAIFPTREDFEAHLTKHDGADWVARNQDRITKFYDFTLLEDHEAYLGLGVGDAQPCSGDSGGPLLQKIDGKLTVVAVVSGSFKGSKYPCSTVGEAYATLGPKVQPMIESAVGPCEGVPVAGRCETTTVARCVAETEGPQQITRTDCGSLDQICGVVDGVAQCVDAPTE